jgi:antitoxin component of RelBE/YafQ-DinJ toxin-antitoxin module
MGVKELISKELNVPFKIDGEASNKETLAAIAELKDGKGKRFKDVDTLFQSI